MKQYLIFGVGFLLASSHLLAQGEKENNLIADGNQGYQNEAYVEAEADYRAVEAPASQHRANSPPAESRNKDSGESGAARKHAVC